MDKSLRPVARPRSKTGEMTRANRPVWKDEQTGESYSERTVTVPYGDGFVVMPSVGKDGATYTEEQIYEYVKKNGPVDFMTGEKLPIFEDIETAGKYARARSGSLMDADQPMPEFKSRRPEMMEEEAGTSMMDVGKAVAKLGLAGAQLAGKKLGMDINPTADNPLGFSEGGNVSMQKQMSMFEDGGLLDEGGMVDEVSGNDVPIGSTRKEVRDDIPARLSEGEFVFPADVVRFYGLEKLMELRQNAKMGLKRMEEMGQMGNSDEATLPDDLPFGMDDLVIIAEPQEFAEGGMPQTNPLPIAPVPTRGPNTSLLSGMTGGMRMVTYVNAEGNTMVIPHVNGVPIYPVPDGYRVLAEGESPTGSDTTPTTPSQDTTTQQPAQTTQRQEGGEQAEINSVNFADMTEAELEALANPPAELQAMTMLAGPLAPFARLGIALQKNGAQKELNKRAEINAKIKTDVEETLKSLQQEQQTPVKGAPVPAVTQSNIDDENVPTATPSVPTTPTAPTGIKGTAETPSGSKAEPLSAYTSGNVAPTQSLSGLTDVDAPTMSVPDFPDITSTAVPSLDEGIMGIDSNQPGQLTGGRDVSAQVAQAVANQAAAARGAFTGQDEAITGITESPVANTSVGARGYANPPSNSANLTGIMGMGTDFSQPGADTGRATSPSVSVSAASPSISGAMSAARSGFGTSRGGEFDGTPSVPGDTYGGYGNLAGDYSGPSTPSGNFGGGNGSISGAESAAAMGFGSDPGGEFGGGIGDGGGASGPSGGSSGGTGGGGADSGGAANGGGSSGGSSGGDAGTGSDNNGDGFGDMGGISGGWNKGGLVSKKAKPKKRKPNTSRGIAARKK